MTLIKSISGIRGLVKNSSETCLSPDVIVKYTNLFGSWIKSNQTKNGTLSIIIARDGRPSGLLIANLIISTLQMMGFKVIDLGLSTTPTAQLAIIHEKCNGGIMISASHNPIEWNGLKLLNNLGEFLSPVQSEQVFNFVSNNFILSNNILPEPVLKRDYLNHHINAILNLKDVDLDIIKKKKFKVVVDGINSSGGLYVPFLLKSMGVEVVELNCVPDGLFAHHPEPKSVNLSHLSELVVKSNADLGIAIDPDVDRLVLVCEDGSFFGEEYTIVSIAKFILSKYKKASVVSNLSTTKALEDVALELGAEHFSSAVGEINVVELMKNKKSIIGGEGSGGIIFPELHFGRDALVGIALFLTYIATLDKTAKELKRSLPYYYMLKEKINVSSKFDLSMFIDRKIKYCKQNHYQFTLIDGLKIKYNCGGWVHIRSSNTEPIIRVISESESKKKCLDQLHNIINSIKITE